MQPITTTLNLKLVEGSEGYYLADENGEQWTPVGKTVQELQEELAIAMKAVAN